MNRFHKKKGVTIIEIIAVLLILVVAIIIINPMVLEIKDGMNKRKYISDVNRYVERAVEMYNSEEYQDRFARSGNEYVITFENIDQVGITQDPYGFTYDRKESTVSFFETTEDIVVNVKSCTIEKNIEYCYEIADVELKDLTPDSIKASVN